MKRVVMNGGDGPNSYTKNSSIQGQSIDISRELLSSSIHQKLTIDEHNSKVYRIADLGCSVGPNTFTCVSIIIEAVKKSFKSSDDQIPEFQVFFSDNVANDFNTLFKNLPPDRQYLVSGVPGSFHGRLFPKASINFIHCSSSLHWLSKVPEQVTKRGSPAWNKGRISYVQSSSQVKEAFAGQFLEDTKDFFNARSVEMTEGGLLAINVPYRPHGSENKTMELMEYCMGQAFGDMVKEGMVSEALVDAFNIPFYMPSESELKQVVSTIENLSIEKMEEIRFLPNTQSPNDHYQHLRAAFEGILRKHFQSEIDFEQFFERYSHKILEFLKLPHSTNAVHMEYLYVLVKKCNGSDQN